METNKKLELYANLMDEVKVRIDCISSACQGHLRYPTPIVREFCFLQLRMLCELIALASLVAHGDITSIEASKFQKAYKADDILKRLGKLRPHFYPQPFQQITHSSGPRELRGFPSPLPKTELLNLYKHCHDNVHRGRLKILLSTSTPIDTNLNIPDIMEWAQKISDLLSVHLIVISEKHAIGCRLRNIDDNNKVQVFTLDLAKKDAA